MEGLDNRAVETIENIMCTHNPFAQAFLSVAKHLNSNPNVVGRRIYQSVETDLRRYNAPTATEIAAVVIGELKTGQEI